MAFVFLRKRNYLFRWGVGQREDKFTAILFSPPLGMCTGQCTLSWLCHFYSIAIFACLSSGLSNHPKRVRQPMKWVLHQGLLCSPSELYFLSFLDPCLGTPLLVDQWVENHLVYPESLLPELSLILWHQLLVRKIDTNYPKFYIVHICVQKLKLNCILSLLACTSQQSKLINEIQGRA